MTDTLRGAELTQRLLVVLAADHVGAVRGPQRHPFAASVDAMDMIRGDQIAAEGLTDWRKLAQGLHARYRVEGFGEAARFVTAVGAGGDDPGHHPRVRIGEGVVDLEVVSQDAVYRDDEDGSELHGIEWVTQRDVDLARRITQIAAELGLTADPAGVSEVELGLDVTDSAKVAPVWAALLTGDPQSQGRGTPGDEIRDADVRIPNLWFGEVDPEGGGGQRFHLEVYVAPEQVEGRVAAAVAAGGEVVDDSQAPGLTVIADPEGNRGVLCADMSAAPA
ncbi:VOC family protein [Helicobacter pylori]